MKVKWNGEIINVENESDIPKKHFFAYWNDYTIEVSFDEEIKRLVGKKQYIADCYDPNGGLLVNWACFPTMKEAVQCCFDNIEYPLINIENEEE